MVVVVVVAVEGSNKNEVEASVERKRYKCGGGCTR